MFILVKTRSKNEEIIRETKTRRKGKRKENCPLQGKSLLPLVDSVDRQSADPLQSSLASSSASRTGQWMIPGLQAHFLCSSGWPLAARLEPEQCSPQQYFPGPCRAELCWEPLDGASSCLEFPTQLAVLGSGFWPMPSPVERPNGDITTATLDCCVPQLLHCSPWRPLGNHWASMAGPSHSSQAMSPDQGESSAHHLLLLC